MVSLRGRLALISIIAVAAVPLSSVAQQQTGDYRLPGWVISNRPSDAPLSVVDFDQIHASLNLNGRVRLLVRLKQPQRVPGGVLAAGQILAAEAAEEQKAALGKQQESVLRRLSAVASSRARKFDFVPFMAVDVEAHDFYDLLTDPEIDLIEEDVPVPPALAQSVPLIGADGSGTFSGFTGLGSTVAILDTGVDKTHPFLSGKVVSEACYSTAVSGRSVSVCPNGQGSQVGAGAGVNCSGSVASCDHGTHVAGIAAGKGASFSGVAQDASIIAIQIFSRFDNPSDCGGSAPCALSWTSDQISGLQQVYALRSTYSIAAANMSIGGGLYSSYCDSSNVALKAAIDNLRSVGIATVIASGNSGSSNSMSSPGCISTAISVGATTKSDVVAGYSNSASMLSLLAPGSSINSSVPGGGYASWSGTSMATPHVTGAWAVMKSRKPSASVDEILAALKAGGANITDGRNGLSVPRIKVDLAVSQISSQPSTILWRHSDGRFGFWSMDGTGIGSTTLYLGGSAIDTAWKVVGVDDFNGDGQQDFLWRHAGGALGVWFMNGANLISSAYLMNGSQIDTSWRVAGVADFDGDGKPDILWQSSNGKIGLWYMNGINLVNNIYLNNGDPIPITWKLIGVADFNKDGKPDLFWQCTDGKIGVWLMNGVNLVSTTYLINGASVDTAWKVVGFADLNGDGDTDILWQHKDGRVGVWFMNGINLLSTTYLYNGNSPGAVWSVVGAYRP